MTSVARPPRRPSTLAIRSRWPAHVPIRDTASALNTGVETRMAKVAEYKRAFSSSLHASILKSRTLRKALTMGTRSSSQVSLNRGRIYQESRPPVVSWFTGCSNRRGGDRRSCPRENGGMGCDYVKLPMMANYVPTLYGRFASLAYGPLLP